MKYGHPMMFSHQRRGFSFDTMKKSDWMIVAPLALLAGAGLALVFMGLVEYFARA